MISFGVVRTKPITQKRKRIVVSAGTPTVIVTAGNEQFCALWTAESPGGTVTTSAYNDVDELLVFVARAITATGDSRTFFCTNSEGAGHSGFHWVA